MKKINILAAKFAELNQRIVADILGRGYSHADAETLALVRENLQALKEFDIEEPKATAPAPAKAKAGE